MKQDLLTKPHWNYLDICEYVGCKKSKAYQIIETCKKQLNGAIRFNPSCVSRDSVLAYLGTTIERETYIKECLERKEVGNHNEKNV